MPLVLPVRNLELARDVVQCGRHSGWSNGFSGPRGTTRRHRAQCVPLSGRPATRRERTGELVGTDALCSSTAQSAGERERACLQTRAVRTVVGGDPSDPTGGVDLDCERAAASFADRYYNYDAEPAGLRKFVVEQLDAFAEDRGTQRI